MAQIDRPIRWGIWSTGHIADKFARDLKAVPDAVLHSVRSRKIAAARTFGETHGENVKAYDDTGFLEDPDLDAIYIASPHIVHCAQAIEAIERGKPALIEKPIAMNADEVVKIRVASEKHKVLVMEALWTRFLPTTLRARAMLLNEELGKPIRAEATIHFYCRYNPKHRLFDPALGGGAMLDLGVYPLSVAQFLLGDGSLTQARWSAAPSGVDHNARFAFTAGGVPVDAAVGFWENKNEQGDNRFIVHCENGTLALGRPFVAAPSLSVWQKPVTKLPLIEGGKIRRAWAKFRNRPDSVFEPTRATTGLNFQVETFQRALREGQTQVDDMPLSTSAHVLSIIEQVIGRPPSKGPFR
ncbi:MAG: Gfo/Idh/MocA family oxidoreductase [Pseudomonadota bacterium]